MSRWEEKRLGELIHIKHGFAFKGEYITDYDNGIVLVTPGNFKIGGGFKHSGKKYYNGEIPEDYILKGKSLIVTMTDLSKNADTLGYAAYSPTDGKTYLHNQRIGLVSIISDDVVESFLYWLLRTPAYQRRIANTCNGVNVKHTSPERIYSYKFLLPNKSTQTRIADILSAYDDLIENNNRRIQLLEQTAQELYKEWFVRFRFPGHENTKFENGLPEGWEIAKLGDYANITTGKCNREDAEENGIYPLFDRSQEIKKSNTYIKDCEAIIVPGEGTSFIPRYYQGKFNLHQRCYCVEPKLKKNGKFLFYTLFFNKAYFLSVATGATVPSLRQNNFTKMKIIYPSIALITLFEDVISSHFDMINSLKIKNENLTAQCDLLLPRLMSGKLEV